MTTIELGFLRRGDTFYHEGQKHRANYVGHKDYNNICCTNLETKKRVWFDTATEVMIEEEIKNDK